MTVPGESVCKRTLDVPPSIATDHPLGDKPLTRSVCRLPDVAIAINHTRQMWVE